MSTMKIAMVAGVSDALVERGDISWADEAASLRGCAKVAAILDGPEELPESGLDADSVKLISDLLRKEAAEAMGPVAETALQHFQAKTASAVENPFERAADVAAACMYKSAADLLATPGDSGDNTLEAAALAGDPVAKLELRNRGGAGAYAIPQGGATAMPEGGAVGMSAKHPEGPPLDAPAAAHLDQKTALAAVLETVKTARKRQGFTAGVEAVANEAIKRAKKQGGGSAGKAISKFSKGRGGAAVGGAAVGAALAAGGMALANHLKKKKDEEEPKMAAARMHNATVRALVAGAKTAAFVDTFEASELDGIYDLGTQGKTASTEDLVLRGYRRVGATMLRDHGLAYMKVAGVDDLNPDQLRALADYIEQNLQADNAQVDLSQIDPALLAELQSAGQQDMEDEAAMSGEDDEPPAQGDEQGPPKQATLLSVMKAAMSSTGANLAGPGTDNSLGEAAKTDPVAELDKKNRPEGSYDAGQGQTAMPNAGHIGATKVVDETPDHPSNAATREVKSAAFSNDEVRYLAEIEKIAMLYGHRLPASMPETQKVAALRTLHGLKPDAREAYVRQL